jgi:hypothetical protein
MSDNLSTGQLIGAAIGAVVGYFIGYPGLGMAVGGMIGYWLDPIPPDDTKPDVEDSELAYNTFTRDTPVTVIYGSVKLGGQIIWIGETHYEQDQTGGGGSGKDASPAEYTTYYFATFAVAFCEGTITEFGDWYLNDDTIDVASDENDINLDITEYTGTSGQTVAAHSDMSAHPNYKYLCWAYLSGKIGTHNSLPSVSCEIKALLVETGDSWAYDANPIRCLYDYLTNTRYGLGYSSSRIDGDCDAVGTTFKIAADYCDELVPYEVEYHDVDGNLQTGSGNEPRFRYSRAFSNRTKGWDVIKDILATCRGMLYYNNGQINVKIETSTEEAVFYFTDEQHSDFTASISGGNTLTATLSAYPDGYWDGAEIVYTSGGDTYKGVIYDQDSGGGTIMSINPDQSLPNFSGTVSFYKDVIKDGSFQFQRRGGRDISNRIRIEFIDRNDNYRTNHAELDCQWDMEETGEIRETTVAMKGIKRETQAGRMAAFLADFGFFVRDVCSFETDLVGQFMTVGDIIGITHSLTGWSAKLFRVVSIEELDDMNTKFTCIEYIPSVYHDSSNPVSRPVDTKLPNKYASPDHVERFQVFVDSENNTIWMTFKPNDTTNYFGGVQMWIQKGGGSDYILDGIHGLSMPSVELDGAVTDSATEIYYDPATMYGSFPSDGILWIEEEKITYTGIDDVNNKFTGCTRGEGNTTAAAHADESVAVYQSSYTPSVIYDDSETGITWTFKAIAVTLTGMRADSATAPTDSVIPPVP